MRRVAYYTNIPAGEYKFRVIASNRRRSLERKRRGFFAITLQPHFYQTYSFALMCSDSGRRILRCCFRLRMRQLRANETKLVLLVDERTRALGSSGARSARK